MTVLPNFTLDFLNSFCIKDFHQAANYLLKNKIACCAKKKKKIRSEDITHTAWCRHHAAFFSTLYLVPFAYLHTRSTLSTSNIMCIYIFFIPTTSLWPSYILLFFVRLIPFWPQGSSSKSYPNWKKKHVQGRVSMIKLKKSINMINRCTHKEIREKDKWDLAREIES